MAADASLCAAAIGYSNGQPLRKVESWLSTGVEMRPRQRWGVAVITVQVFNGLAVIAEVLVQS